MFSSACPTQAAAEVFQFQRRSLNRKLARLVGVPERCDLTIDLRLDLSVDWQWHIVGSGNGLIFDSLVHGVPLIAEYVSAHDQRR